jgi:hypothetical protein
MNAEDFRRIALGMTGAIESAHMGHPDFRAGGRIFATLSADNTLGMVSLTPEQQQEYMRASPGTFVPAAGAWGRGGSTMVRLESADADAVGDAMTLAWQRVIRAAETRASGGRSKITRSRSARSKNARSKSARSTVARSKARPLKNAKAKTPRR